MAKKCHAPILTVKNILYPIVLCLTLVLSRTDKELTKLNVPERDIKSLLDDLSKDDINLLKMCNKGASEPIKPSLRADLAIFS